MGSGTGVLAILAQMRGATSVDAIDIDTWCFENALENVERNNADKVDGYFRWCRATYRIDIMILIIANINRNILLVDIPTYAKCLSTDGILLLSGFYEADLDTISSACD